VAKNNEIYFSICISLYNKQKYISETINSLLKQSYKNFEIVIVNDGSTDDSAAIVEKLQKQDNRIKLINQENKGVSVARNVGVENAKYDYVCLLDADDGWCENYLQIMRDMVVKFPKHKFFSLRHEIVESDGRILYPTVGVEDGFCGEVEDFLKLYATHDGLVHTSSVCLDKEFFLSLGGFPEGIICGEDTYLWILYGLKTNLIFCNKICTHYYRDREFSHTARNVQVELPYQFDYFLEHKEFDKTKELDSYLRKSAFLHVAGLKIANKLPLIAFKHSLRLFKNSKLTGIVCLVTSMTPSFVLRAVKSIRDNKRVDL